MDLLIEKLDGSRYYLSQYKVLITEFEESAPSVTRNNMQLDQRNGNIDFGGWHTDKTINITGYYRADNMDEEEALREKLYALLSDPDGYYITQLKTSSDTAMERPGETSGNYYDKLKDYPSHKRFLVYTESPEMELVGNVNGTLLYKLTAEFKTMKLPYGETPALDVVINDNMQVVGGTNLLLDTATATGAMWFTKGNNLSGEKLNGCNVETQTGDYRSARYSFDDLKNRNVINTTDDFVFSAMIRVDPTLKDNTANIIFFSSVTDKNAKIIGHIKDYADGYWHQVSVVFKFLTTPTDTTAYAQSLRFEMGGSNGATVYCTQRQLEKGSVATAWSPAPEDPEYNNFRYSLTGNVSIPYSGTVPCNQLEQQFAIELTAKGAASSLSFKIDDTELTSSNAVAAGDIILLNGFSYTQNGLSIVSKTNKAYFILQPDKPNRITCNVPGTVRIIGFQNLYA